MVERFEAISTRPLVLASGEHIASKSMYGHIMTKIDAMENYTCPYPYFSIVIWYFRKNCVWKNFQKIQIDRIFA